jgi:processive 1,2-diacylglycerol beta-glucosyltransferase
MLSARTDLQVIVVCGRDQEMRAKIEQTFEGRPYAKVYGFVEQVHELMTIADFMISKAGGLTVSEALCTRTPMLIYRTIPGQEDQNAKFLQRHHAALITHDFEELTETIDRLIMTPGELEQMKRAAQMLAKPQAAETIAAVCEEMIAERSLQLVF